MKKLILLALVAVGVVVLVKNKSEQLRAGAAKVTRDPRVQSALATASERTAPLKEKAAPYADVVREKAGAAQERLHHAKPESADLTAPEVPTGDPLTDPLPGDEPVES